MQYKIRRFEERDIKTIKRIIKRLHPKWFDKNALKNIPIDIRISRCLVVEKKDKVIGFISIVSRDSKVEIKWTGVDPDFRRKGIGKRLLERAEKELKRIGVRALFVKTVGEATPRYKPYEETVKFYKAMGFKIEKKHKIKKEDGYKSRMYTFKKQI